MERIDVNHPEWYQTRDGLPVLELKYFESAFEREVEVTVQTLERRSTYRLDRLGRLNKYEASAYDLIRITTPSPTIDETFARVAEIVHRPEMVSVRKAQWEAVCKLVAHASRAPKYPDEADYEPWWGRLRKAFDAVETDSSRSPRP